MYLSNFTYYTVFCMHYSISTIVFNGITITLKRPILGEVKAGYDLFLESSYLGEEEVSLEEYKQGDYFLKVQGNSMIHEGIIDGSLVYIKQCNYVEKMRLPLF